MTAPATAGLRLLMDELPDWEVVAVLDTAVTEQEPWQDPRTHRPGTWLLADLRSPLGVFARFAVLRTTGAVYRMDGPGVHDDPWLVPEGSEYGGPLEEPLWDRDEAWKAFDLQRVLAPAARGGSLTVSVDELVGRALRPLVAGVDISLTAAGHQEVLLSLAVPDMAVESSSKDPLSFRTNLCLRLRLE